MFYVLTIQKLQTCWHRQSWTGKKILLSLTPKSVLFRERKRTYFRESKARSTGHHFPYSVRWKLTSLRPHCLWKVSQGFVICVASEFLAQSPPMSVRVRFAAVEADTGLPWGLWALRRLPASTSLEPQARARDFRCDAFTATVCLRKVI